MQIKRWRIAALRLAVSLCLTSAIGACSSEGPGENWSIGVSNASTVALGYTKLCRVDIPQSCWAGQTLVKPRGSETVHIAGYGGSTYFRDSANFIPEEAMVSWHGPVREEQSNEEFKQEPLHGPYLVKIRSTIPPDILAKARRDGYMLEIGVTAGVVPPDVDWRLMYMGPNFIGPSRLIARGGPRAKATEDYEKYMDARMKEINAQRAKQKP